MTTVDAMKFLLSVKDNNTLVCIRWGEVNKINGTTWNKKFIVMFSPGEHYEWLSRKPTIDIDKKTLRIEAVDCDFDLNTISVINNKVIGLGGSKGDKLYQMEIDPSKGEDWCDICCRS